MTTITKSMSDLAVDQASQANGGDLGRFDRVKNPDRSELRKISEDFESLFLGLVVKSMRQTVQKSGLIDGGNGEDIFSSMLDDEYAKIMAAERHTGIADNIEDFLLRSYGQKTEQELAFEKGVGMKTYQQQGLQNVVKQARIETSGIPSAPIAPSSVISIPLIPSSQQKPF
jgi:Rod binding domain-containing protein